MKHLLLIAAVFSAAAVSATEITVTPRSPWKAVSEKEFAIEFDGGKTWPTLEVKPVSVRQNTYYKLTFDAKDSSGKAKTQTGCRNSRNGKQSTAYLPWRGGTEFTPVVLYFKSGDTDALPLFFNINPGPAAKIAVRNPALTELAPADLGKNLLEHGDFESGSDLAAYSDEFEKSLSIVPSPSFLSGEKSLKATKEADGVTEITSRDLPAVPGKTIEVKFWAKSAGEPVPARIILDFGRAGHRKHLYREFRFKIEPEWKEFTFHYAVPADTETYTALTEGMAKLRFGLLKSPDAATVYFDNVEYRIK